MRGSTFGLRSSAPGLICVAVIASLFAACSGREASSAPGGSAVGNGGRDGNGSGGSEDGQGGGTILIESTAGAGGEQDPCLGPNPPDDCQLVPSGPACGDGEINQDSEACDDGNTLPGDGCSGICKVEPNFVCPTPGQPCEPTFACGNGEIEPGEVCDDGNAEDNDGCDATCTQMSLNYVCITPGEPCERIVFCGDGRVAGAETCEDGNTTPGDGCDADCNVEPGWICLTVGAPCEPQPTCGDGILHQEELGEMCDDGNLTDGDGCTATCLQEDGWLCPEPGQPCQNLTVCGDDRVTGAETCDDGNSVPDDGCDNCQVQPGYECPFPGAPCIAQCGDGILLEESEICDDGNTVDGDGCSSICEWEDGFACTGDPPNYTCTPTVCGNGVREGTESCDDGNTNMGDGCTPFCDVEPDCTGSACTSVCGDGLLLGSEECDDGNNRRGDGCSDTCQVEPGYECNQPELGDTLEVPIVYRDFDQAHPDFNPGVTGCEVATTGMVDATLDAEGKPVLIMTGTGCGHTTTAASFATWYRDTPGQNTTVVGTLTLWDDGAGNYVNRWGDNGEQWATENPEGLTWCADEGGSCDDFEYTECYNPCTPWGEGNNQVCADGTGGYVYYDGNPTFFPIDGQGQSPQGDYGTALIPEPVYHGNWQAEESGELHNFHFTSEVRFWFAYDPALDQVLEFTGDDDVWVFINDRLAVDLGGIHMPVSGSVDIAASATSLGLTAGNVYEIVVFQAEREKDGSSYKLTLSGFNVAPSECGPICGDGVVSPGEQCDDGQNIGGYNQCNPDCTRGSYCGDGIVNGPEGGPMEECDNGVNMSSYSSGAADECAPGCLAVPYCGDGDIQVQFGERCDDGVNDGSYETCNPDCSLAPRCGDAITQPEYGEECDDGLNNGAYNTCAPGCVLGPRCGDGVLQEEWGEDCDDGNNEPGDGCSPACGPEGICGDGFPDTDAGEQCDDGENDGGYGECAPGCVEGPRCGDGVVQAEYEQCDDGVNAGGYGECAPGCVLGPHCGDGLHQSGYEECDDGWTCHGGSNALNECSSDADCPDSTCQVPGSMLDNDGCSMACKEEVAGPA
jgi:fibro-slime domain-containing protein